MWWMVFGVFLSAVLGYLVAEWVYGVTADEDSIEAYERQRDEFEKYFK